jgi:methionine sulfoxide reductase catalytic subunit
MLIKSVPTWAIPEREAAPEGVYLNRRRFLSGAAAVAGAAALAGCDFGPAGPPETDPSAPMYPAPRNPAYTLDRPITPIELSSQYNNFYEFGSTKSIQNAAQALRLRPWEIRIDGEVEKPFTIGMDDLLKRVQLEERLYRLRCVETWAIAVPWTGFPLRALIEMAKPKSGARWLRMRSFENSSWASGQLQIWYPWPYSEGLRMDEAQNELAFLVTGAYGKPLLKQFGAPLRLAVPWKYGFKSIKSIQHFTFTSARPFSFWEQIQPGEYGFWANVNPEVDHPRWSQARERVLGETGSRSTMMFNGYAAQVAGMYAEFDGRREIFR